MDEEIIDTTTPEFAKHFKGFTNPATQPQSQHSIGRYIAILTGKGEGCDYTIGCNRTTIEVSGDTLEEAERNFVQHIEREYRGFSGLRDNYSNFDILLVEVAQSKEIDMQAYVAQEELEEQQEKQREREQQDRAEYERLKARFEGKS